VVGVGGFVFGSLGRSLRCAGQDFDDRGVSFHRLFDGERLTQERLAFAEPTLVGDHRSVRFLVRSKSRTGEKHRWKTCSLATSARPKCRDCYIPPFLYSVRNIWIWLQRKSLLTPPLNILMHALSVTDFAHFFPFQFLPRCARFEDDPTKTPCGMNRLKSRPARDDGHPNGKLKCLGQRG
jgi:hypothetical protein